VRGAVSGRRWPGRDATDFLSRASYDGMLVELDEESWSRPPKTLKTTHVSTGQFAKQTTATTP
jgi:hypothetical protein